ncbi:hypothetical protein AVDCRST_MAG92-4366 [uncultured Coleofasciculus sp.]|uniref:Uncharacterized protein n=1 Tax=uncultured Coleofasciculus sp. TaxID=1267456 RepID=A0A6J4K018_9CYAN|nr:hypothetical protein AVDCRST_MAG92-4366 [uncultured Coleofasciculus sp.]
MKHWHKHHSNRQVVFVRTSQPTETSVELVKKQQTTEIKSSPLSNEGAR